MITETITAQTLSSFAAYLRNNERSEATVEKYMRYARAFASYTGNVKLTKKLVVEWKDSLTSRYTASGVNGMLASVNSLLTFIEKPDVKVTLLKVQRALFTQPERELKRHEIERMISVAKKLRKTKLALMIQTMLATGIRVSELKYITVEAVTMGQAEIRLKGKTRVIFISKKLCKLLLNYTNKNKIMSGMIFTSKHGNALSRFYIWREMKTLSELANVSAAKVFPHNLRKLFARTYFAKYPNLAELADILGHSDVNTTRIYTAVTGTEFRRKLDALNLAA